jgi:hypothetical protein
LFSAVSGTSGPVLTFAFPESFSAVPDALCPVFTFCAPGLIFGGSGSVGSRFHVLCSRNRFRLYRGRRVPFSRFALQDSFSGVSRASGPVFKFYAPGLIFNGNEGSGPDFTFCAPGHVFGGIGGVGSCSHVLRSRAHFQRYRERRVPFSRFVLPESFSAVPRASGPVFTFRAPELVFGGTGGVGSRFHVLRSRTHFRR